MAAVDPGEHRPDDRAPGNHLERPAQKHGEGSNEKPHGRGRKLPERAVEKHRNDGREEGRDDGGPVNAALRLQRLREGRDQPVGDFAGQLAKRVPRRKRPIVEPRSQEQHCSEKAENNTEHVLKNGTKHGQRIRLMFDD